MECPKYTEKRALNHILWQPVVPSKRKSLWWKPQYNNSMKLTKLESESAHNVQKKNFGIYIV